MPKETFQKALMLHQSGQLEEAKNLYETVLQQIPAHVITLHLLGILNTQQQNYEAAAIYLKKAIEIAPNSPDLHNSLGNFHKKNQEFDLAKKSYQKALTLNPHYASAYNNLGILHETEKQWEKAKNAYQMALLCEPGLIDACFNLARLFVQEEAFVQAEVLLQQILEKDSSHPESLSTLGFIRQQTQHYSEAIELYKKRLTVHPHHALTELNLGICYLGLDRPQDAIYHLEQAILDNPTLIEAHYNLASSYLLTQQPGRALTHYLFLLQHQKEDVELYYNIGVIYLYQDHYEKSEEFFLTVLSKNPQHINTHHNLATLYLKQQAVEKAIAQYERLLTLEPNNEEIQYIYSALQGKVLPAKASQAYVTHLFDQYAPYYEAHLKQSLSYSVPEQLEQTLFQASLAETAEWKVIDLGCGTGLCGERLKKLSGELIGVDLSVQMLASAEKKRIYNQLIQGDIFSILPTFSEIDLIVAGDVIPYLGALEEFFQLSSAALKEKGLLLMTVEKASAYPFELQKTLRYAHHSEYLKTLSQQNHLTVITLNQMICRYHHGKPVEGYVLLAQRHYETS